MLHQNDIHTCIKLKSLHDIYVDILKPFSKSKVNKNE